MMDVEDRTMKQYRVRHPRDEGTYPITIYATHTSPASFGGTVFFVGDTITGITHPPATVESVDDENRDKVLAGVRMADFYA